MSIPALPAAATLPLAFLAGAFAAVAAFVAIVGMRLLQTPKSPAGLGTFLPRHEAASGVEHGGANPVRSPNGFRT